MLVDVPSKTVEVDGCNQLVISLLCLSRLGEVLDVDDMRDRCVHPLFLSQWITTF